MPVIKVISLLLKVKYQIKFKNTAKRNKNMILRKSKDIFRYKNYIIQSMEPLGLAGVRCRH